MCLALWSRDTASLSGGLESRQAHLCQTPHPISSAPMRSVGGAWTSASDQRVLKLPAPDEHYYHRSLALLPPHKPKPGFSKPICEHIARESTAIGNTTSMLSSRERFLALVSHKLGSQPETVYGDTYT